MKNSCEEQWWEESELCLIRELTVTDFSKLHTTFSKKKKH